MDLESRIAQLEDEAAIKELAARFADSASRKDIATFKATWASDATWEIGAPNSFRCEGIQQIQNLFEALWSNKSIFMQFVHSGTIEVNGARASARWVIHEIAQGPDGVFYTTSGFFDDEMEKRGGRWVYVSRIYTYIHLSTDPFLGQALALPAGQS